MPLIVRAVDIGGVVVSGGTIIIAAGDRNIEYGCEADAATRLCNLDRLSLVSAPPDGTSSGGQTAVEGDDCSCRFHLLRRFWNQIFTWVSVRRSMVARPDRSVDER